MKSNKIFWHRNNIFGNCKTHLQLKLDILDKGLKETLPLPSYFFLRRSIMEKVTIIENLSGFLLLF